MIHPCEPTGLSNFLYENCLKDKDCVQYFFTKQSLFGSRRKLNAAIPLVVPKEQFVEVVPDFIMTLAFDEKFLWPQTPLYVWASEAAKLSKAQLRDSRIYVLCESAEQQTNFKEMGPEKLFVLKDNSYEALFAWIHSTCKTYHDLVFQKLLPLTLSQDTAPQGVVYSLLRRMQYLSFLHLGHLSELCVLLVGGYGRGEGGSVSVSGVAVPSNNLDVLVVLSNYDFIKSREEINKLRKALWDMESKEGVSIDFGAMKKATFEKGRLKLFFYDLANGHKLLLGDDSFLKNSRLQKYENIPLEELLSLVVNRSSLLLLNRWIQGHDEGNGFIQLMLRHTMKAAIACGDYFLFVRNAFSWSYRKKMESVQASENLLIPEFKQDYLTAVEFRFFPDYTRYTVQEINVLSNQILSYAHEAFADYCQRKNIDRSKFKDFVLSEAYLNLFNPFCWLKLVRDLRFYKDFNKKLSMPWKDLCRFCFIRSESKLYLLFVLVGFMDDKSWGLKNWVIRGYPLNFYVDVWQKWGDPNFYKLRAQVEGMADDT